MRHLDRLSLRFWRLHHTWTGPWSHRRTLNLVGGLRPNEFRLWAGRLLSPWRDESTFATQSDRDRVSLAKKAIFAEVELEPNLSQRGASLSQNRSW